MGPHPAHTPPGKGWVPPADVEAEARRRGRQFPGASEGGATPLTAGAGLSTDAGRVPLLPGDYGDALRAQLGGKDARAEMLERLLGRKETRRRRRDRQVRPP